MEKIGRRLGTLPPRRAADTDAGGDTEGDEEAMEVAEMEIEPEMIVAVRQPLASGTQRSMTARAAVPPPVPAVPAADAPRFFNIPIAQPGTSMPPPIIAYKAAQASSIATTLPTPRRLWRRPLATTNKGHDSTSIVSPLPPPARSSAPGTVPGAAPPRHRISRNWMTVGISAIAAGAALTTFMLLVSWRGHHATPAQVASVGVTSAAPLDSTTAAASPKAALSAPGKPTAAPPAPHPPPHIATHLDAKHATPAHRPIATNAQPSPAAPAATKHPASIVTRERSVPAGTKTGGPASRQPTKLAAKSATKGVTKGVTKGATQVAMKATTKATKPPVATATARTSKPAGPKLAARTQAPAATANKPATRTAQPAARGTAKPKGKSVASIDPKPVATKKPARR